MHAWIAGDIISVILQASVVTAINLL